jgi:hypothetical protein
VFLRNRKLGTYLLGLILVLCLCTSCAVEDDNPKGDLYVYFLVLLTQGFR